MDEHVMKQDFLDDHRIQLCKYVIAIYLKTRLNYEANNCPKKIYL